jgi:L-alanine-DL-glutamate epimerase-like enolase superfamily enzyme
MMQREKPGGHTERSIAIGTIEVAVWDAVAKIANQPLHRVLAEHAAEPRRAHFALAPLLVPLGPYVLTPHRANTLH